MLIDFDLYLSNWGINKLFRNDGNSFSDVTDIYHVYSDSLSNGAAWGDFNNDGRLDLWAANIRSNDDLYMNDGVIEWGNEYSPNFLTATQDIITGDYNNDLIINVIDVVLLIGFILQQEIPSGSEFAAADFNEDNLLNVLDVVAIVSAILEGPNDDNHLPDECYLEPETGPCFAAIPMYYFDSSTNSCEMFIWGGCQGVVPFQSLSVCQYTCEQ